MSITAPGSSTCMFSFQMKPGKVTLFNLAPGYGETFHLIATRAKVEDIDIFSGIQSPHFFLKISGDVRDFLSAYSRAGGTHHLAMAYGDHVQSIRDLAQIAGLKFTEI